MFHPYFILYLRGRTDKTVRYVCDVIENTMQGSKHSQVTEMRLLTPQIRMKRTCRRCAEDFGDIEACMFHGSWIRFNICQRKGNKYKSMPNVQ